MKKRNLIMSCLLLTSLTGDIAMAEDNNRTVKATTIGHYQKPGAPIDITYESLKVGVNETSDVKISLTTTLTSGDMEVDIDFDKDLKTIGDVYNKMTFSLNPNSKSYDINMQVSSSKDGLYYIRLLTKVNSGSGAKMRAFAVPIYVGDGQLKRKSKQLLMKALGGENLSISNAEETVEAIK
jgi:hypothetical protein